MHGGDFPLSIISQNKSFDCAEDFKLTFDVCELFDPRLLDILLRQDHLWNSNPYSQSNYYSVLGFEKLHKDNKLVANQIIRNFGVFIGGWWGPHCGVQI